MCRSVPSWILLTCVLVTISSGCRTTVPIHAWTPPQLESAVGKRVALSGVLGPKELTRPIEQQLFSQAPADHGRQVTMISLGDLVTYESRSSQLDHPTSSGIQLVSAMEEIPNDLAVATVARNQGIDYVMRGEVISKKNPSFHDDRNAGTLSMSWRLTGLDAAHPGGGTPIVLDVNAARRIYPDLAFVSDANDVLCTAMAREALRLITPSVDRFDVVLETPYLLPGSDTVRQGNLAARKGRWGEAENLWNEVYQQHPTQIAALHNLALAAAAGQDFTRAKKLARKAIRLNPSKLHQQTLVWIELKQREYHQAFALPDPPEGWFLTDAVEPLTGNH